MKTASIAIDGNSLAILGSENLGFAGPVIQKYEPFTNEEEAIAAAKVKCEEMGYVASEKICRPFVRSFKMTARRRK